MSLMKKMKIAISTMITRLVTYKDCVIEMKASEQPLSGPRGEIVLSTLSK